MLRTALAILLLTVSASAQTAGWTAVRAIAPGTPVRVQLANGQRVQGLLEEAADDSVAVKAANGKQSLVRADVRRVAVKHDGHRGRNALIGLGIGTAAGLGVGAGIDHAEQGFFPNLGKAVFTPLGAIIGLVVGAVIPTGGWHDVYRTR